MGFFIGGVQFRECFFPLRRCFVGSKGYFLEVFHDGGWCLVGVLWGNC